MIEIGDYVRYIGEDTIVYEPNHLYEVTGYDDVLKLYEIMSEVDESYLMDKSLFEELTPEEKALLDK